MLLRQYNCKLPICREVYICMLNIIMNEKFQKKTISNSSNSFLDMMKDLGFDAYVLKILEG